VNGILEQLRTYYQALQPGQQRILAAALIMALGAVVGVASWSAQDHTKPLLTASNPGEIQAVAGALDADGIAYQVSGDGRTISVAPVDEGRARVSSARAGKIVGLELLDSVELGTSPKREQWAYQRGLQGELELTISSLEGVSWAKVHVVMPERSPFLRDEQAASASVTVGLVPGGTLSKRERLGITALVAGAVEGLRADNVALIDQEGTLLSGGGRSDSALAGQATLFEIQLSNEARTRAAIEDALFRVLGNRTAMSVAVTVDLETKATDKVERRVVADESALVSESIREENTESSRPTGVPGAQSNIPEQGGPNAEAQTQNSTITDSRNNYEPTRVEERETRAPGTISRVSVAVTVNKGTVADLAKKALVASGIEEPDATVIQEREAELQKQIEQTVRVAMGFDATRKDSLAVEFLPFSQSYDAEAELMEASESFFDESILVWTLLLFSIALFFFIVIRPLVGAVAKAALPPLPPAIEPAAADAAMALTDGRTGPNGGLGVDGLSMDDPAAREAGRNLTERLRSMVDNFENVDAADLNRLVDLEREATAQVLHRWIREG
jgi:flagellar M-ring protein FliF